MIVTQATFNIAHDLKQVTHQGNHSNHITAYKFSDSSKYKFSDSSKFSAVCRPCVSAYILCKRVKEKMGVYMA